MLGQVGVEPLKLKKEEFQFYPRERSESTFVHDLSGNAVEIECQKIPCSSVDTVQN